jgi:hypothetical protein
MDLQNTIDYIQQNNMNPIRQAGCAAAAAL